MPCSDCQQVLVNMSAHGEGIVVGFKMNIGSLASPEGGQELAEPILAIAVGVEERSGRARLWWGGWDGGRRDEEPLPLGMGGAEEGGEVGR